MLQNSIQAQQIYCYVTANDINNGYTCLSLNFSIEAMFDNLNANDTSLPVLAFTKHGGDDTKVHAYMIW